MQPVTGLSVFRPQFSQERALAESVPANPAFSTQKLTKAEHQAVSSLEAKSPLKVVDLRYSTMRGLSSLPAISEVPSSFMAISNQKKAATGASFTAGCKYLKEAQPMSAPCCTFCQCPSEDDSIESTTLPRSSIAMTFPSIVGASRKLRADAVTTSFAITKPPFCYILLRHEKTGTLQHNHNDGCVRQSGQLGGNFPSSEHPGFCQYIKTLLYLNPMSSFV